MAGFRGKKVVQHTAIIDFDESSPYHGYEVRVRLNVPVNVGFTLNRQFTSEDDAERAEAVRAFAERFVLAWNLQEIPDESEDDEPVDIPCTPERFCDDMMFALAIMTKWMRITQDIPAPLGIPSNGTVSPVDGLALMATP